MAIREDLELDLSGALGSVDQLDSALSTAAQSFETSLAAALEVLGSAEPIPLEADASAIAPEIDASIAASNGEVPVTAETSAIPPEIDASLAAASGEVPVSANTAGMDAEIAASLSGTSAEVEVTADTSQAEASIDSLGESAGEASGGMDELGASGANVRGALDVVGTTAATVSGGVDLMGARALGAGGALKSVGSAAGTVAPQLSGAAGGMAGLGAAAAGTAGPLAQVGAVFAGSVAVGIGLTTVYTDLAGKVRSFSSLTGESAETSSTWVGAASAMGIESGKLTQGFALAARNIGNNSEKLEAHGIAIARNDDGTVSLTGTILNAGEAFRRATDSTEKARIGQDLFGRSWRELVPLLARSGEEIEALGRKTGLMFSQSDLDRARQFSIDLNTIKTQALVTAAGLGEVLLPAVGRILQFFGDLATGAGNVGQALLSILGPGIAAVTGGLGGLGNFFAQNELAANALAVVIAARLIPALITMGIEASLATGRFVASQWAQMTAGVVGLGTHLGTAAVALRTFGAAALAGDRAALGMIGRLGLLAAGLAIAYQQGQNAKESLDKWGDAQVGAAKHTGDTEGALRRQIATLEAHKKEVSAGHWNMEQFKRGLGIGNEIDEASGKIGELKGRLKELEGAHASIGAAQLAGAAAAAGYTGSLGDQARAADALAARLGVTSELIAEVAAKRGVDLSQGLAAAEEQLSGFINDLSFATAGQLEFSRAWEILGDATADATEKTQAYKAALDALNGAQVGSESTLNQLTIGLGKLSDLAPDASRSLNQLDVAGAQNRQTLVGLAGNVSDAAAAHQRLTGDVGAANMMLVAQRDRLIEGAVAAGFDRDTVTTLINELTKLVPPPPVTPLVDPTPAQVSMAIIESNYAASRARMEGAATHINADGTVAHAALGSWENAYFGSKGHVETSPTSINADPAPAEAAVVQARVVVDGWHVYVSTKKAPLNVDPAPAQAGISMAQKAMDGWHFNASRFKPPLNVDPAPAQAGISGVEAAWGLFRQGASGDRPPLDVDNTPAIGSIDAVDLKYKTWRDFVSGKATAFAVNPTPATTSLQQVDDKRSNTEKAIETANPALHVITSHAGAALGWVTSQVDRWTAHTSNTKPPLNVNPAPVQAGITVAQQAMQGWHFNASLIKAPLNVDPAPAQAGIAGVSGAWGLAAGGMSSSDPQLHADPTPAIGSIDAADLKFNTWHGNVWGSYPGIRANPEPATTSLQQVDDKRSNTEKAIDTANPAFRVMVDGAIQALQWVIDKAGEAARAVAGAGGSWNPLNRMAGGPVNAGQAYIVGERHAELFVPDTSGTIVPRVPPMARGEATGGGGSTTVAFNIDARGSTMTEAQFRRVAREEIAPAVEQVVAKVRSK